MAWILSISQLPKAVRRWGLLAFWLRNVLCATRACIFLSLIWTNKWLRTRRFSEPTFRPPAATNHWRNSVICDFSIFYLFAHLHLLSSDSFFSLIFFLLLFSSLTLPTFAFHLSILSEVWLLNLLRLSKPLRTIKLTHSFQDCWLHLAPSGSSVAFRFAFANFRRSSGKTPQGHRVGPVRMILTELNSCFKLAQTDHPLKTSSKMLKIHHPTLNLSLVAVWPVWCPGFHVSPPSDVVELPSAPPRWSAWHPATHQTRSTLRGPKSCDEAPVPHDASG